jgi:uncharacterized protein YecT (DUF1311 family)
MIRTFAFLLALGLSPAAAQDLRFDAAASEQCLINTGHAGNKSDCIGVSASICMEQPGGDSTYGMGFCLDSELTYWDGLLNDSYQQLRAAMQAADADLPDHLALQATSLRDMQRAWIAFRDTRCGYETSLWQGGTGSGPAYLACALQMTGEQALYLSATLSGEG